MPSGKINEYILKHSVGSECLFRDEEAFLRLLYAENGRVAAILWWDRCKKTEQRTSVGMGGYADPDDPEYMYAETQLYENGFEKQTLDEVLAYVHRVKAEGLRYGERYFSHELVPSFYLAEQSLIRHADRS